MPQVCDWRERSWARSAKLTSVAPIEAAAGVVGSAAADEDRRHLSLLEVVFSRAVPAVGASLLVAGLVSAALWSVADRSRLVIWLVVTAAVMLFRYAIIIGFVRRRKDSGNQ